MTNETQEQEAIKDQEMIKDQEYDEFKQYETTKEIIDLRAEIKPEEPKPELKEGQMLISEMTIEQLRNAVTNLMTVNNQLNAIKKDYEDRARRIQVIWNSKAEVKKRYFFLRDNPIGRGKKIV